MSSPWVVASAPVLLVGGGGAHEEDEHRHGAVDDTAVTEKRLRRIAEKEKGASLVGHPFSAYHLTRAPSPHDKHARLHHHLPTPPLTSASV
eukprot:6177507-Pleurochrysis_carterae.AAC.1